MPPTSPPFPPAPVRPLASVSSPLSIATLLVVPLSIATLLVVPFARAAPFDGLDPRARDAVVSACLPAQYRDGAEAYRRCVEREAEARAGREPGALELLDLDDRYAVERRCSADRERSEVAWFDCIDTELEALALTAPPPLAGLREDERHALLRNCFEAQSNDGAAAWRSCMTDAALALRAVPAADLSALGAVERNALQAGCAAEGEAAAYRRCLLERGVPAGVTSVATDDTPTPTREPAGGDVARADAVEPEASPRTVPERLVAGLPATEPTLGTARPVGTPVGATPQTTTRTTPSRAGTSPDGTSEERSVSAGPEPVDPSPTGDTPAPSNEGGGSPDLVEPGDAGIVTRLGDAYGTLDDTGRMVLWGALALPLLLLASSALIRRRGAAEDDGVALAARVGPTRGRPVGSAGPAFGDSDGDDVSFRFDDVAGGPRVAPGHTSRVRERLHGEADDLFDALDRDLESEDDEDPDDDFADDSRAFGAGETQDFGDSPRTVRLAPARREGRGRGHDEGHGPVHDLAIDDGVHDDRLPSVGADGPDRDAPTRLVTSPLRDARTGPHDEEPGHGNEHGDRRVGRGGLDGTADIGADAMADVEIAVARGGPAGDAVSRTAPPSRTRGRDAATAGGFGAWLVSRPDEDRRDLAIEFLVYWMAWGDERYEPATRDVVFADAHPDDITVVKRRVLEEDVDAFADTVRWLVLNASREARSQILELLVALLVTDAVPTPVQNTLLRFLADVFGLGASVLEAQFEQAFEAPLPPLPRADRPDWWAGQDEAVLVRREGRALASATMETRHRARLGLRLDGPLSTDAVLFAFDLAARRTAPERFDALGHRERDLAARQLDRFADARDALLETLT